MPSKEKEGKEGKEGKITEPAKGAKLCLTMIMKNESHVIERTLENIHKYITDYVIVDTGSTDNSIKIVTDFFHSKGIKGFIFERSWKEFDGSRTEAFELANKHSKSDYMWVFDADDLLIGQLPPIPTTHDWYKLKIGKDFTYPRHQIFRIGIDWKYVGVRHEYPCPKDGRDLFAGSIEGDYYIDSRREGDRSKDPNKYKNDALAFMKSLEKDPNNARDIFYCAQSWMDHGDLENAILWYRKRTELVGFYEEVAYSRYKIAQCLERLGKPDSEVIAAYLECFHKHPQRMEPIRSIAEFYRKKNSFELAYLFAKLGSTIPLPKDQQLFIDAQAYRYNIFDELFISAYWEGLRREQKGMESYPFYLESFQVANKLLIEEKVPENQRDRIKQGRDFSVSKIKDSYAVYNKRNVENLVEVMKERREKKRKERKEREDGREEKTEKGVIFTVTTCKRLDLFTKTINSFLECCEDLHLIDRWICVDDNSSEEDRKQMKTLYPFFDFIFKSIEDKGHSKSMNIILDITNNYKYWLHMEDDWQYFEKRRYIQPSIDILEMKEMNHNIAQVLFNINYAETVSDRGIKGGKVLFNNNSRYILHEHYTPGSQEHINFYVRNAGHPTNEYWPNYSLRPSLIKTSAIKTIGRYNEKAEHFEMEYAYRYTREGYSSAFFDTISCLHIGRLTRERFDKTKQNAYELNNESQFVKAQPSPLPKSPDSTNNLLKQYTEDNTKPYWYKLWMKARKETNLEKKEKDYLNCMLYMKKAAHAEPIYELAMSISDYEVRYRYLKMIENSAIPKTPEIEIDRDLYNWKITDQLSICCYYTDRKQESLSHSSKLISMNKFEHNRFINNAAFCLPNIRIVKDSKESSNFNFEIEREKIPTSLCSISKESSHISIWKEAKSNNKSILIVNDETILKDGFISNLCYLLSTIDSDYDICFLESDSKIKIDKVQRITKMKKNSLYCYIITPNAATKLLDNLEGNETGNEIISRNFNKLKVYNYPLTIYFDNIIQDKVAKLIESKNKHTKSDLTFTVTTCKRWNYFQRTMDTLLLKCKNLDIIDHWLCVDDNSSLEDQKKMKERYPFFKFIFKDQSTKGHPKSMNIIWENVTTTYAFHFEDDWLCNNDFDIKKYLDYIKKTEIGQVILRRISADDHVHIDTVDGNKVFKYIYNPKHSIKPQLNKEYDITNKHPKSNDKITYPIDKYWWWPGFTLNPSIFNIESMKKQIGEFNLTVRSELFEYDYSARCYDNNIEVHYVNLNIEHIGDISSYSLNDLRRYYDK